MASLLPAPPLRGGACRPPRALTCQSHKLNTATSDGEPAICAIGCW